MAKKRIISDSVKIMQIAIGGTTVVGLGSDGLMYAWDTSAGIWYEFWDTAKTAPEVQDKPQRGKKQD